MNKADPIWSVSAVNRMIKETIEGSFMPFWMGGEATSMLIHRSGHVYFQMKDERSQIKVCWFGGAEQCRKLGIKNGTVVEVWGSLSVYDVRGEYQFVVRKLRPAGIGLLQQKFEEVKSRLAAEGLFDPARKKPIPRIPGTIGVVSSPSGAAIRDFLQILFRRFPGVTVKIYPALVQGSEAAAQVAAGVRFFNGEDDPENGQVDVIVVTRGGGSMEDLWCFNDEKLARTVAASKIPVISAVGHEIDFTICDFVSDLRAPTPSAAAELVIANYADITAGLERTSLAVDRSFELLMTRNQALCTDIEKRLTDYTPVRLWEKMVARVQEKENIFEAKMLEKLSRADEYLQYHEKVFTDNLQQQMDMAANSMKTAGAKLFVFDPMRQLERGYTITYTADKKHVIYSSHDAPPGTEMQLRFADGTIRIKAL